METALKDSKKIERPTTVLVAKFAHVADTSPKGSPLIRVNESSSLFLGILNRMAIDVIFKTSKTSVPLGKVIGIRTSNQIQILHTPDGPFNVGGLRTNVQYQ